MRDALGGLFNITLLFTFLFLITGFVLFGINYYKAFSVKNKIITTIEQYEGNMGNPKLKEKIEPYIRSLNYNARISNNMVNNLKSGNDLEWDCNTFNDLGFCFAKDTSSSNTCLSTFLVKTFVNTDVPVFNSIFSSSNIFTVSGETKVIRSREDSCR